MQKVQVAPFQLIGIHVRTTNQNGQATKDIGALWERFISENLIDAIPNKVDNTIYSLYTDYVSDHTEPYTTLLGCKVNDLSAIPAGMVGRSFEGGNYIKLTSRGDLTKGLIVNQWTYIWEMDLGRIFTADFEAWGEKAKNPLDAEVDFFIATK